MTQIYKKGLTKKFFFNFCRREGKLETLSRNTIEGTSEFTIISPSEEAAGRQSVRSLVRSISDNCIPESYYFALSGYLTYSPSAAPRHARPFRPVLCPCGRGAEALTAPDGKQRACPPPPPPPLFPAYRISRADADLREHGRQRRSGERRRG